MIIDHNIVGPLSALVGALFGGLASMIGAIYTHRRNERLQRVASEVAKRETIYADFVMSAVNLVLKAYTSDDLALGGDEPRLIGLVNRMRIFASSEVVASAEAVLTSIVAISLEPGKQLRDLAQEALTRNLDPDPLLEFSLVCRADLENVRETTM